jgi:predicted phage terminase large subunit-like protein
MNLPHKDYLLDSLLVFIKFFYHLKTGREFHTPTVIGRESHYLTLCKRFEDVFYGRLKDENGEPCVRLLENIPPGFGKSTICIYFLAWAFAKVPFAQSLYISYAYSLAEKHTNTVKEIMEMPMYGALFDVYLDPRQKAKGNFATTAGGRLMAFGSSGPITGMDAGLPNVPGFSGVALMDDMHKPDEVHSDTIREGVWDNYMQTILPRPRSDNVPSLLIGQCLHEDDVVARIKRGMDGFRWAKEVLKAIDDSGNALAPQLKSLETLRTIQEYNPYVFASQYQQDPIPAGGALFKEDWFITLDEEPNMLATFITADTAETDKTYNDATVFSFWGIYKVKFGEIETDEYALHLLDCVEIWVQPAELENEFYSFYTQCMRNPIKPTHAAIEKKSTGVTLISSLRKVPGIRVVEIERTAASRSKSDRFLEIQPYIGKKLVTLPRFGKHNKLFVDHMIKITANDTHRRDDIADTCVDAVRAALIDKLLLPKIDTNSDKIMQDMANLFNRTQTLKNNRGW